VGFAQLTLDAVHELMPHPPAAELNRLYVQERFTAHGIGKALLARAETLARAEGASTMWLTAWVGNARALAFYPRCGYQDRGPTLYEFRGEQHGNRLFAKALDA
jgi:GNAT superfamily N-acetyltransferase